MLSQSRLYAPIVADGWHFAAKWDLDGLGNWSSFDDDGTVQTRATNDANEITSTTGLATPAYDRAGNMIETAKPGDPANEWDVTYDAWNRVVQVTDGTTTVAYEYDGHGRRTLRVSGSTEEHFYYDGQQVVEVRQPDGQGGLEPATQYVWSLRYVDSPILRDSFSSGTLVPADRLYYLTDANHNVTAVVDIAGDVQERYDYDAYGKFTIYDANWANPGTTSAVGNTLLFAGQDVDVETGLQYSRARWYNAALGSFISRDPLGFDAEDANLYRYVFNSPANYTDPSGQILPVMAGGALIAANIVVWGKNLAALDRMMRGEEVPCSLLITSPQFWGDVLLGAAVGALAPVIGGAIAGGLSPAAASVAGGALGAAGFGAGLGGAAREASQGNYLSAGFNLALGSLSGALGLKALRSLNAPTGNPPGTYRPSTPLPRGENGEFLPSSPYPHTQIGTEIGRKVGPYTAAREFGHNGRPIRDIHFTDHGRPNVPGHTNPHQHRHIPNPTGGTPRYGGPEPFTW
jgi:RHS repeat-associated protein